MSGGETFHSCGVCGGRALDYSLCPHCDDVRERRARVMRADVLRSLMPIASAVDAAATVIERKRIAEHDRREVRR
jgi:hypothetical protein